MVDQASKFKDIPSFTALTKRIRELRKKQKNIATQSSPNVLVNVDDKEDKKNENVQNS